MANNNLSNFRWNPTPEERLAAKLAAQQERDRLIQKAIQNGAHVQYMSSRLTTEEWETHVYWDNDGKCIIDTTIPGDIKKCIRRGWKIKSITYYQDSNQIAGIVCEGKSNNISILTVR